MDLGIKGKWALVGGASKGLGYGCAQSLAREGVNVVIVARGAEALEAAAKELRKFGTTIIAAAVDITTTEGREVIWSIKGGPGKNYDIVVTNAGGPPPGDFRNLSLIHISEPTRLLSISYAVFCLKKKKGALDLITD